MHAPLRKPPILRILERRTGVVRVFPKARPKRKCTLVHGPGTIVRRNVPPSMVLCWTHRVRMYVSRFRDMKNAATRRIMSAGWLRFNPPTYAHDNLYYIVHWITGKYLRVAGKLTRRGVRGGPRGRHSGLARMPAPRRFQCTAGTTRSAGSLGIHAAGLRFLPPPPALPQLHAKINNNNITNLLR